VVDQTAIYANFARLQSAARSGLAAMSQVTPWRVMTQAP
jgi:hypothetical protein